MLLTNSQLLITILALAFGTMLTRIIPFIILPNHERTPKFVRYLALVLPSASIGLLVVYCLKDSFSLQASLSGNVPLAEIICIATTLILHLWKRNFLLSIFVPTALYMLLSNIL